MINRYTLSKMKNIWSEENKFKTWLKIELLNIKALNKLKKISDKDLCKINKNSYFLINDISKYEKETHHEMIAFLKAISKNLGNEKKWIHYGLTSTDVIDTSFGYLLKKSNLILIKDLKNLLLILKNKSNFYKKTLIIGRTHGMHAEPTTLGLKFLSWFDEMNRNKKRFEFASKDVETGKISGAVGTFANVDTYIEEYICKNLGIKYSNISTQIISRDNHSFYLASIASIATSIEKMSTEIRHLQRSEINELEEFFDKKQKGSSAMPHKRNPIASENLCGCARVIRGYMLTAYENVNLWHERDISHSSAERIIFPDALILLNYMINRFSNVLKKLIVYPDKMLKNLNLTSGLIFSEQIMIALINKGINREEAYNIVQKISIESLKKEKSYKNSIEKSEKINKILSKKEIKNCFDINKHLKNIDLIYKRQKL